MKQLIGEIGKNMRSIVALVILVGSFAFKFKHPESNDANALIMLVGGYYFIDSKNRSDELKAKIKKDEV